MSSNNIMRELSLREIQEHSLNALKTIAKICDDNGIHYFLLYGTLLGSIRHKGFIPWDDDIDIGMMRIEYERFINYCIKNKKLLHPYRLLHYRTDKKYIFPISRFIDMRFTTHNTKLKYNTKGLFVDIFPFDNINMNDKKFNKKRNRINDRIYLSGLKQFHCVDYKSVTFHKQPFLKTKRLLIYLTYRFTDIFFFNNHRLLIKIDKICKKENKRNSEYVNCLVWYPNRVNFDKRWLLSLTKKQFEDQKYSVPLHYDEVLKSIYLNYMDLPKKEDQLPHHSYKAYEIDK